MAEELSTEHLRCLVCGGQPAITETLRHQVGMVVLRETHHRELTLCREHGTEASRVYLKKSLVRGWWGVTSFFANFWYVFSGLATKRRFERLPAPSVPPPDRTVQGSWSADPFGRFQLRWWVPDGWSEQVSSQGFTTQDAVGFR